MPAMRFVIVHCGEPLLPGILYCMSLHLGEETNHDDGDRDDKRSLQSPPPRAMIRTFLRAIGGTTTTMTAAGRRAGSPGSPTCGQETARPTR
jgi:hypothetical protein